MAISKHKKPRVCETHIQAAQKMFPGAVGEPKWVADDQVVVTVAADSAPEVIEFLYYKRDGWMPVMVGNDERQMNGHFALYYTLSMEGADPGWIMVRVEVPRDTCTFRAVSPKVPAAVWSEREVQDMFGLKAEGIIDGRNLVLPDDWPQGLYPLRKDSMDYRYRPAPTTDFENYEFLKETNGRETTIMPMGPLHITSDEPGHFRLFVEGEEIVDADYRLFYIHRGMEKCAEARMTYDQVPFLAERICGICGYAHSVAYAETIEHAQGIKVPLRAQAIRAILLETERLHSHLLNLGLVCHYTGFDTGFQHFFRVREKSMDLAELLTGGRKTYGLNLIGGVRRDILAEQKLETLRLIGELRQEVSELVEEMVSTPNFMKRTEGVGILDRQIARDYSPVGPLMRGSGFARDVRWVHPFDGYKLIADKHKPITHDGCDVLSRTLVRIEEFMDSLNIIQELLEMELPQGPVLTEGWTYEPNRFALGFAEAPRGEDVHWSMVGDDQKCYRWRAKASTYSNWPVLRYMFRGNTISDAALIVGSLDPCYSCTERVTVVDVNKRTQKTLSKTQLENYCANRRHSPLKD